MSTRLGTLTLDLIARIGNFTGPIREAERQAESSFSKMRKHVNTYGLAVAGAAAGAVTALAAMAIETSNQAAELEIFAFRANTTTQEFQKMAVGAAAFGIEGDKLSDMMKDFNEKLGELTAVGAGGGVDFFEKIAMKTEGSSEAAKQLILDMQKLSGPEALQMYVDKLEEAGVTQQQMSFYLESMASDMTDLYPLLANGGEGLRLYGDMAERAGIIMTDQTREAALALKDQVYMLDLQLQGAKNQLMQAVIPAFVDIAEAFLGGSEQGLQFTGIAEGVAKTLKWVAAAAIGAVTYIQLVGKALGGMAAIGGAVLSNKDWYEMGPLGYAKAAYDARDEISALTSEIKTDMHETIMGAAERLDKMWEGGASKKAEQLRGIRELNQTVGQTNGGLSELADKQNKVDKAASGANKALQEQNRLLEQQAQARNTISYDYLDDFAKFAEDHKRQVAEIEKANFGPLQSEYIAKAKSRYEFEEEMYLRKITEEINSHKWSEERKLEYSHETQRIIVGESGKYNKEIKELKLKALDEQYAIELQKSRFHAQNMRQTMQESISGLAGNADDIFARATMSPADYDRWSLENDRSNAQVDLKKERVKVEQDIKTAPADVYADDDARYQALLDAHKEYRDGLAAIDVEYAEQVKELESQQYTDSMNMYGSLLSQASSVWGDMTQLVKDSQGEQSGSYKAMFLMQQMFAIGSALVSTHLAAAQVMADPSALTLPQKTMYSNLILGMGYANVGLIAGQTIAGFADGGYTGDGGKYTIGGIVHKGEGVLTQEEIAALGGPSGFYALRQSIKSGFSDGGLVSGSTPEFIVETPKLSGIASQGPQVSVVVENYTSGQVQTKVDEEGRIRVIIRDEVDKYLPGQMNNSNSKIHKAVVRNTTATTKR